MVKTRQSGGLSDDFSETFITLKPRTRRTARLEIEPDGYATDESAICHYPINNKRGRFQDSQHVENDAGHHERHRRHSSQQMESLQKVSHRPSNSYRTTRNCRYPQDTSQSSADSSTKEHRANGDIEHAPKVSLLTNHVDKQHADSTAPGSSQNRRTRRLAVDTLYDDPELMHLDMYTRVKRERRKVVRDMYNLRVREDRLTEEDSSTEEEDRSSVDEEEELEEGDEAQRPYFLRQNKPVTKRFEAPPIEPRRRQRNMFQDGPSPELEKTYHSRHSISHYRSPAHKSPLFKRKRHAVHQSSSTGSSDSSEDERRFERRKARSMAKARNRCLPLNLRPEDVATGVLKDRMRVGASLADVDPMTIDSDITFDCVGGLGKYIQALKEMVVFPLLYPEVFDRFKISPPKGVLFHGPPGTGKTLVARALANESSLGDRRIAFFMRKGADCLSKWVGESERQLRLLFDQAYSMRPSIIFFDEIDGLAPVRSSRQDQIHSSIVSTLLALMDGLDNRGEIVIIGATNRLDSIDPALRRPGRFDREFFFPLPNKEARRSILRIHTREWNPRLCTPFLNEVADKCVGYCGADLKALCTEAALFALRRKYPQIYNSKKKLQLDVSSINVTAGDFQKAMFIIVPTAQRSVLSSGRVLSHTVRPLLQNLLNKIIESIETIFPIGLAQCRNIDTPVNAENSGGVLEIFDDSQSEDEDNALSIFETPPTREGRARKRLAMTDAINSGPPSFLSSTSCFQKRPPTHKPKVLLSGTHGQGQNSHLAPAVLHHLEGIPVHRLDLSTLFAVSFRTPEESCAQILNEAKRTSPSILYIPHIGQWWDALNDTVRATFLTLLDDMDPTMAILLLATSDVIFDHLPLQIQNLFKEGSGQIIQLVDPDEKERRCFFEDLILNQTCKPLPRSKSGGKKQLEVLPVAPPPEPRNLTESELKRVRYQEESTMRELRLFLRDILKKLAKDRRFSLFSKPVDCEEVPDYLEVIKQPMDLSTMMTKIDMHQYDSVSQFLADVNQVCNNALEYNPDKDPADKLIRHRACELKDTAQSMVEAELDPEFEKLCQEIQEARKHRGETPRKKIPPFSFVLHHNNIMNNIDNTATAKLKTVNVSSLIPNDYPTRYSRRLRGMDISTPPASENESNNVLYKEHADSSSPIIRRQYKKKKIFNKPLLLSDNEVGSREDAKENEDIDHHRFLKQTLENNGHSDQKMNDCTYDNKLENSRDSVHSSEDHSSTTVDSHSPNQCSSNSQGFRNQIQKLDDHCKSPVSSADADSRTSPLTEDSSSQHSQSVCIDRNRLLKLLDNLIKVTEGCNIEILERLYTSLSQFIFIHRKNPDRTILVQDMEKEVKEFSQHFAPR